MTTKVPVELSSTPGIVDGSNATAITIDSSERVGIGTASPSRQLTVENTIANTGGVIGLTSSDSSTSGTCGIIHFGNNTDSSIASINGIADGATDAGALVFKTEATGAGIEERMRISSAGNVGIGTTPATGVRLDIRSNAATTLADFRNANSSGYGLYVAGGSNSSQYAFRAADKDNNALFSVMGDGAVISPTVQAQTTSESANMVVRSSGNFERSTSSERYKNSITNATKGLAELKTLRPVNYKGNNDGDTVFYGLIAEEVHDAGLTEFVEYDDENKPDALRYPHMVALCVKAIQELSTELETAKARLKTLEDA
jgi:hypothetical protein